MIEPRFATQAIAAFALRVGSDDLDGYAADRLKRSLLDAIGCALGALDAPPVTAIRGLVDEFGGTGRATMIGGGRTAPDRACLVNGCLVRYVDFMDNIASKGEVCHPSDNIAALVAAGEHAGASGRDLLLGLAVSYQVQSRLMETLPTMRGGLNYTTPLAYSVAAGSARLLGFDAERTAHALALAGVSAVSLAVIQAEPVSNWKGLASGETASRALLNTFIAGRGVTGTLGVFDGPFGLDHLVRDHSTIDWSKEPLDAGNRVSIKRYNAEFQSQTSVEAAIELGQRIADPGCITSVTLDVAKGAYDVLGGGSYGPKDDCRIKEQADHNLKYLVAAALIDRQMLPEQFAPERIERADVQELLGKVTVRSSFLYTRRIPEEMPCKLVVHIAGGEMLSAERSDYDGFHTRPMSWDDVVAKFDRLASPHADGRLRAKIVATVRDIERHLVTDLMALLALAGHEETRG
ncbi:MmgE/PrpD family protein [uncultured Sphingomonas sp.]|uniref:MmgE/PrpD family protein n=1 Tax=uncultured Sphingomonas sp. TaxID=158754 RepID=UPI0035CA06BF